MSELILYASIFGAGALGGVIGMGIYLLTAFDL